MARQFGSLNYVPTQYDEKMLRQFDVFQNLTKKNYHSLRRLFQKDGAAFWHKVSFGFEKTLQICLEHLDRSSDRNRFKMFFGDFTDRLRKAYYCYLLSPETRSVIPGEMFICDGNVFFYGEKKMGNQRLKLYFVIPYTAMHKAVKAAVIRNRGFPSIVPIAHGINPKIIQIYCIDGKVHQFGGFGPMFDKMYDSIVSLATLRLAEEDSRDAE